jgi:DNA repair photolyase
VGLGISLAMTDEALSEAIEPGTPGPKARLKLVSRLREAGLPCGVMAMPILPWLSDSDEALDALFGSLAAAGATGVSAGALYLKPGTREWFMKWIAAHHPELAGRYRRLYGTGSYASKEYRAWLAGKVRYFKARHGFSYSAGFSHRDLKNPDLEDPRVEEAEYPAGIIPTAVSGGSAGLPSGPVSVASRTAVQDSLF